MDMRIERLDHLGVVAGVIRDLKIIDLINEQLGTDVREEISIGECVAGMILNGLGFSNKPLSMTPRFFQNKPLELLFGKKIEAEYFNRSKLGRALDALYDFGCGNLFYQISSKCCVQEKIDVRFNSADTTSLSLYGEYDKECDEQAIKITYGHSKDCRPDLKQVVHEMMVSQDGGIPLMMQTWDGNESDSIILKQRAESLIKEFSKSERPCYLIADSKLYSLDNAKNLRLIPFITRIPGILKEEQRIIQSSIQNNQWINLDEENKYCVVNLDHYDIKQRWIVVNSCGARNRAEKSVAKSIHNESESIRKEIKSLKANEFKCKDDAEDLIKKLFKKLKFHEISHIDFYEEKNFPDNGRPKKDAVPNITYKVNIDYHVLLEKKAKEIDLRSCYVIGTNISEQALSNVETINAYKGQNRSIENMGFRFLKDPLFFTSSLFIKKPERIEALLMMMTLSLLVYAIAQRRMREFLKEKNKTIPNQINKPTQKPTLRWLFQLLDGINWVHILIDGKMRRILQGMDDLKKQIISCFGELVESIYCFEAEIV